MLEYTVVTLTDRTWFTKSHARSQFTATWTDTLDLLEREIRNLDGRDVVFEVDVRPDQLRNDGRIRSGSTAATPGVVIRFESRKHGPLVYRCDRFDLRPWSGKGMGPLWQHNVRAIALTLERLRQAEMYGAIDAGQQYTGFKALPGGRAMPASHMTRDEALAVLAEQVNIPVEYLNLDLLPSIYKTARRRSHPDHKGGDRTVWDRVEAAAAVLGVK